MHLQQVSVCSPIVFSKKIGEYDTINKCEIDDEIRKNMNHFITPERTTDYYQR